MQVNIEDVSPVEKKLSIEIPWEQVKGKLDEAYRHLGNSVQVRGFRKGKVPRAMLERMFGRRVQEEVTRELVQDSFFAAAAEHQIQPVAEPVLEDASLKAGEGFRFSARVEVRSPVDLKEWAALPGTRRVRAVTDGDVDHALQHKREMHTEYRPIEGRAVTAETDVVMLSLRGTIGEFPIDKPELTVDLSHADHEPLPGLSRVLTGVPLDAKDLPLVFDLPAETAAKELAGKTARLAATIREAREKVVPALDDEFAKDTGEADTLAELKAKLRGELEGRAREAADRELRGELLKELVARNPVELAPSVIERGIDSQLARARLSFAMQGIDIEKTGVDLNGMRDKLRDGAADEVRGQFLLEALADQEQLTVTDEEVERRVAEMATAEGRPVQKLRAEMDKDGSLESLRFRLRQEKALDLVVSRATITDTVVDEAQAAPAQES